MSVCVGLCEKVCVNVCLYSFFVTKNDSLFTSSKYSDSVRKPGRMVIRLLKISTGVDLFN